ncbi:MAG: hypothetical protein MUO54_08200 [Anaerolineales bacterium]|nr:hypothetical protein [Anaerolineales bacterium]
MKNGLQEINELIGVWGSLVCNNQGDVIVNSSPSSLNKASLENITRHIVELLSSAGDSVQALSEVVLHYSQKILFVLDLKQVILVVICTPSIDISLLRMSVNVVKTRWEGDSKVQQQMKKFFVERL